MKISILCKSLQKYLPLIAFAYSAFFLHPDLTDADTKEKTTKKPIHVEADKMTAEEQSAMVEFSGDVKAVIEDSTLFADSVKIYFFNDKEPESKTESENNKEPDAQNSIKKIIAAGDVKYISKERKAFSDKAVYTTLDEILILTGESPKLITGSSFVTGKKITLFRKNNKVIVESDGSKRVEAFLNPEDNITKEAAPEKKE